ncbi:hypothetical protein PV08_01988 [Exophiala spinifera]|uniref:Flavin-nucleotide-binding protein n=1 Tax=Exophiala spinifera TaxID=91928 RepID=A0A0D2BQX9_9EURO|nr:uncharacterized protein PV08_01988 [Exophiala spinifera]KIW21408.1 hypothetical protein PV08_01988 [Exophiala spinifera]
MGRSRTLEYPKTAINKVNRYNVRETYDLEAIHTIINESTYVNVSFNTPDPSNPFPVTLPMIGVAASFDHPSSSLGEPLDIYVHGYVSARLMNLSRKPGGAAADSEPEGLPVTISATKVDGLILSLTPYTHDLNYRSAMLYGYATVVTSPEEKLWAMEAVTNTVVADRWRHTRVPPVSAEMSATSILKVKVVGGSGKIRVGGPRDEKKDTDQAQLVDSIWTGVIPVYEHFADPVPGRDNKVDAVPDHVVKYAKEMRERNQRYAMDVINDTSQD